MLDGIPDAGGLRLIRPLPYLEMIGLLLGAHAVVTDSGGVQEEACLARVPCVTVRTTTERIATIEAGANRLAEPAGLGSALDEAASGSRDWAIPEGWDGGVAERAVAAIRRAFLSG
jgi:UDP-N-acetylglucosamine 2-epimerase (non-hydrolysing)